MDLTFTQQGNSFVAEFEATADFNIHLERDRGGVFRVYQRTAGSQYALVDELDKVYTQYKGIVDYDFAGVIFPKMIKVVSATEPSLAVVTFAS